MKQFLIKIALFGALVLFFITLLLKGYGGNVDFFYEKFTTPKQVSMILGDSRAMQGIQPKVLDSCLLNSNYKLPNYNFSFTIAQAAYGPSYLNAIKRKLDTTGNKKGLFIVTVNPWMLANRSPKNEIESDIDFYKTPPHNMKFMTCSPNFEYLAKNFNYFHFKAIFKQNSKLHKDGWLEERNLPTDSIVFKSWKLKQLKMFINWSNKWTVSNYRLQWLNNTITYLKQYGKVVVVRMPIDQEFVEIENNFYVNFNEVITKICKDENISYVDFSSSNNWNTYDGHHLDTYGGKLFSVELSKLLLDNKKLMKIICFLTP